MGLFSKKKEISNFTFVFSQVECGIIKDNTKVINDEVLIQSFILLLGRYFLICEKAQIEPVKQVFSQIIKQRDFQEREINRMIFEAIYLTLIPLQKEAVQGFFVLGEPPLYTSTDKPDEVIAEYRFKVFDLQGDKTEKLHMSYMLSIMLLPLSVSHFYTYVTSELEHSNSISTLNSLILEVINQDNTILRSSFKSTIFINKLLKDLKFEEDIETEELQPFHYLDQSKFPEVKYTLSKSPFEHTLEEIALYIRNDKWKLDCLIATSLDQEKRYKAFFLKQKMDFAELLFEKFPSLKEEYEVINENYKRMEEYDRKQYEKASQESDVFQDIFPFSSYEDALPMNCVTNIYIYFEKVHSKYPNRVQIGNRSTYKIKGKLYDVFNVSDSNTQDSHEIYFDVSWSQHGRLSEHYLMMPKEKHLPDFRIKYKLVEFLRDGEFIAEVAEASGVDLRSSTINFLDIASDEVNDLVSHYDKSQNSFYVLPVKEYFDDIPLLHSFYGYRLLLEHQIQHAIDEYDPTSTEAVFYKNGNLELRQNIFDNNDLFIRDHDSTPANDFIYYTLTTHTPDAFHNEFECRAYTASLHKGFGEEIFSLQEILVALQIFSEQLNQELYFKLIILSKKSYQEVLQMKSDN